MRFKSSSPFLQISNSLPGIRSYGTVTGQYFGMKNITRACQGEMHHLRKRLASDVEAKLMDKIYSRLGILITYHSLKMTDGFSLSLEETTTFLTNQKTTSGASFIDQLRASNHFRILNFCRTYQQQLENSSSADESVKTTLLKGIRSTPITFVRMFGEGGSLARFYNTDDGTCSPESEGYYTMLEKYKEPYLGRGKNFLIQTQLDTPEDPFMNAAKIHNEFAKAHQADKEFGLLFSRLYMNFALMLTGHMPAIIDSSKKEEYLARVQPDKLEEPKDLAYFLLRNLQDTYQDHVLPDLENEAKRHGIDVRFGLGNTSDNYTMPHMQQKI